VTFPFQIYDTSGLGRLSVEDFSKALFHTLAFSKEYAFEIFEQVDRNKLGYITFGKNNCNSSTEIDFADKSYR
jgi:Ca2+-binding EF-hand superfamily protein